MENRSIRFRPRQQPGFEAKPANRPRRLLLRLPLVLRPKPGNRARHLHDVARSPPRVWLTLAPALDVASPRGLDFLAPVLDAASPRGPDLHDPPGHGTLFRMWLTARLTRTWRIHQDTAWFISPCRARCGSHTSSAWFRSLGRAGTCRFPPCRRQPCSTRAPPGQGVLQPSLPLTFSDCHRELCRSPPPAHHSQETTRDT